MSDKKKTELTEEELRDAAGGRQTLQSGDPEGTVEGKKPRSTREGKLTFRRAKID